MDVFANRAGKACLVRCSSTTSSRKRRTPLRNSTSKGGVRGRRSQVCRPYSSPPEETLLTYSTLILPTTQHGVPKHAPADKQGGSRQNQRPRRRTTALGEVLLHCLFHFHFHLLRHGGRHKDQHGHQCGYGQIKYPLHESLPPSVYSSAVAR